MAAGLSRGIAGLAATTSLWRAIVGLSGGGGLGGGGDEGYTITIPGAVITGGGPGVFNETTGTSGTIATATTDLPDLGSGFQWGIYAGSDARIGVVSTATGQGNTMGITTSSAIYTGDSANFTVTVTNGVKTLGFPFTATGTVGLLLDRLTASPTVAYSLRKLRSAYAGSCIRVRRTSDSVESDIGFSSTADGNGDYWVDAAAIASFAPGGCTITTWYDQTTNARNATQIITTKQPVYQAIGWASSKPALSFDGTDDFLAVPDHRGSFTTEFGLVAVARGSAASGMLFNTQQTTGDNSGSNSFGFNASGKMLFTADPTTGGRPQPATTADFRNTDMSLIGSYDNTSGALMRANGESPTAAAGSGSLSFGTGTTYTWAIGIFRPTLTTPWAGTVGEIIMFNTAIGSTDQTTIRTGHTAAYGAP